VDGCEKLAGAQQAGEVDRATELEPAAALLSCDRQRSAKATLDFRPVGGWQPAEEFAAQAAELCVGPVRTGRLRRVGGIPKEGVLEDIDSIRWHAATVEKVRRHEGLHGSCSRSSGSQSATAPHDLIRKLSAERRTDLRYISCRAQRIEAGGQQPLQGVEP